LTIKSSRELHEQTRSIQDELKEWKEKYINLEEEKEKMAFDEKQQRA
jgi:hypothetical protein